MDQEKITSLSREVLGEWYRNVELVGWKVRADTPHVEMVNFHGVVLFCGEEVDIHAEGPGFLETVFRAFKDKFGERFPSLKAWRGPSTYPISAGVNFELMTRRNGERFRFTVPLDEKGKEGAIVRAVVEAVEFFVNAERAYAVSLQRLTDAKTRARADLIDTSTEAIANLIDVANFEEVVKLVTDGRYPSL